MDTIFDLSAAPHLPPSLRTSAPAPRPEFVLQALTQCAQASLKLNVYEFKGEIYISMAEAA